MCIWVALPFDWLVAMQYQMLFAVVLLSLIVVTGYAGQISLAQMGIAGIGALMSAWLYSSHHLHFLLAALLGIVAVVPVVTVIAAVGARTRGAALAIVTLGLAFSLEAVFFTNQNYTGGINGLQHRQSHHIRSGGRRPRVPQAVRHADPHRPGRPRADGGQPPAGTGGAASHRSPHQ